VRFRAKKEKKSRQKLPQKYQTTSVIRAIRPPSLWALGPKRKTKYAIVGMEEVSLCWNE